MGMQDRDWYREYHKEKEKRRFTQSERAKKRQSDEIKQRFSASWDHSDHENIPTHQSKTDSPWHWSLMAIFWAIVICVLTFIFKAAR